MQSRDEIGSLARSFNRMAASLAEKTSQLEETYFSSMEALARAIDGRDPYTFGHSSRVAAIGAEIAAAMGLGTEQRLALRRATLLHDIGKIGIEDRVLRKPSRLTDEEAGRMREHPRIGYEMLKGLRFLQPSLAGVRHHHERWDGSGYPDGIGGSQIPLLVRILTVADVFDADVGAAVPPSHDPGRRRSNHHPRSWDAIRPGRSDGIRILPASDRHHSQPRG